MRNHQELFTLSYWQIVSRDIGGQSFIDAFYARFLDSDPKLPEMFKDTRMAWRLALRPALEFLSPCAPDDCDRLANQWGDAQTVG